MAFDTARMAQQLSLLQKPPPIGAETFFRNVNFTFVKASRANILTGEHSGRNGGRCNAPKSEPTCYLAGTQTNAALEVEQEQLLLGIPAASPPPRLTVGVTVEGAVLLDLCNNLVVKRLGLQGDASDVFMPSAQWKDLNGRGVRAPLQEVGEAARAQGYDGVRYRAILSEYIGAALPWLENVALFMDASAPSSSRAVGVKITLHDAGVLSFP